jgi:hypothetical protein
MFPQSGAGPRPEEESQALAATVEEPKKMRRQRVDWAGLPV